MTLGNELLTVGVREARTNLRSLVEQVGDGTPARIMVHNRPVAVLLRSDEADRWERIYLGLAALHGLEIYPELAAGDTSKVAKMVRGEVRATDADLRRLARSRSEILRAAEYVGLATVRVKFAVDARRGDQGPAADDRELRSAARAAHQLQRVPPPDGPGDGRALVRRGRPRPGQRAARRRRRLGRRLPRGPAWPPPTRRWAREAGSERWIRRSGS